MSFESFPYTLGWEITLECNLQCKHCGSSAGFQRKSELSTEECLTLCDQFPAMLVQEVDFTGGEPLIRKDLAKIISYLKNINITSGIVTNGILLTYEKLTELKEAGLSHIAISIDGLKETHDLIRQEGVFFKAVSGIKRCIEEKMPITVITTVNDKNITQLPDLFKLFNELGVKRWRPQPTIPLGRVIKYDYINLNEHSFLKLITFMREYGKHATNNEMDLLRADGTGYFFENDEYRAPWYGCPAGIVSVGITSDGKVKGCLSLPDEFIEGDLRKRSLWNIWFDKEAFKHNRNFSVTDLGSYCRECEKGEQCRGGCCAISYGSTKEIHNDPYCYYRLSKGFM